MASTSVRPDAAAADGADDLVDVDRLGRAVALCDPHGRLRIALVSGGLRSSCRRARARRCCPWSRLDRGLAQHRFFSSSRPPGVKDAARNDGENRETAQTTQTGWRQLGPYPPPARLPGRTAAGFLPASDAGRSSGLRALRLVSRVPTVHRFPAPEGQCVSWASFSLTAAGQPRILTGFPLSPGDHPRAPAREATYGIVSSPVN